MIRLIWQVRYALCALRSRYDFTLAAAWSEASASWEHWEAERSENEPRLTPAEAFGEDEIEWRLQW